MTLRTYRTYTNTPTRERDRSAFKTYLLENPDVQIHHVFLEEGNDFCGVNEDHRSDLPRSDSDEWDTDEVLKEVNDVFDLRQNLADWEEENDEDDA